MADIQLQQVEVAGGFYYRHETAIVSPDAQIGADTRILPYALVGGVVIGEGSTVGPYAEVEEGAQLGAHVGVWNHSKVRPGTFIDDGSGLGHASIINTNVGIGRGARIQNHVSIPEGVSVGDGVFIGPGAKFPNDRHPRGFGSWQTGKTELRTGASIGANATVVCGERGKPTVVGEFATLAAGSTATRSLRPFGLYRGNERMGWVNVAGDTVSHNPDKVPPMEQLLNGAEHIPPEFGVTLAKLHEIAANAGAVSLG